MSKYINGLFEDEFEEVAIDRIKKFAVLANKMNFEIAVGFSGGKDSQVVYDLCKRSGIEFKAYYNVCFESSTTRKFIKKYYPDVIWRRDYKVGFIENIAKHGILPTPQIAYCCNDYKHNRKYVDECSIVGVRREEGHARKNRTPLSLRNKTTQKKIKGVKEYFKEHCQSIGTASVIQLLPIVDWREEEVWNYIKKYNIPINPEYKENKRVGCLICPKTNFNRNYKSLLQYPKLIDAVIRQREKTSGINWIITSDNKDYAEDKVYYVCRWLNRGFLPFTEKQKELYEKVLQKYKIIFNT